MTGDDSVLSWKESPEERRNGSFRVRLTGLRPKADIEFLATMVASQKDIDIVEARAEVKSIGPGKPVECTFSEVFKARMFCLASEMKGAVCDLDE